MWLVGYLLLSLGWGGIWAIAGAKVLSPAGVGILVCGFLVSLGTLIARDEGDW